MKRFTFAMIALLAILAASLSAQVDAVVPSSVRVHDIVKKDMMAQNILQVLAEKHHVVIGVYGTIIGRDRLRRIDISIEKGTLADVFDAITKADPRFEWYQNSNGSVYFVTQGAPFPLMDVTVHSFDDKNPQESEILDRLENLPEIHEWLQDHKCIISHTIVVSGQPPIPWGEFSVRATDFRLSSILDEIAAKSGTYYYDATQFSAEPCRLDIGWGQVQP